MGNYFVININLYTKGEVELYDYVTIDLAWFIEWFIIALVLLLYYESERLGRLFVIIISKAN